MNEEKLICPDCGGTGRLVGEDYDWKCYACHESGEFKGTLDDVKRNIDQLANQYRSWQQAWDEPRYSWDTISQELKAISDKYWRFVKLLRQLAPDEYPASREIYL